MKLAQDRVQWLAFVQAVSHCSVLLPQSYKHGSYLQENSLHHRFKCKNRGLMIFKKMFPLYSENKMNPQIDYLSEMM
jgi:hypothetical protein